MNLIKRNEIMQLRKKERNLPILTLEQQYSGHVTTHREMINFNREMGNKTWHKERHFKKMLTKRSLYGRDARYGIKERGKLIEFLNENEYLMHDYEL